MSNFYPDFMSTYAFFKSQVANHYPDFPLKIWDEYAIVSAQKMTIRYSPHHTFHGDKLPTEYKTDLYHEQSDLLETIKELSR